MWEGFNEQLDDDGGWHDGPFEDVDEAYDHLCPQCYLVIVEGEPETRDRMKRTR